MKRIVIFNLLFVFMIGCSSKKIMYDSKDDSLLLQSKNGTIWLSSLHSSHQIKIVNQEVKGDTLFVNYQRGAFVSSANVLNLTNETNYLKCANKIYRVIKTKEGFELIKNEY